MDNKVLNDAINNIKQMANEDFFSRLTDEQFKELSDIINEIDDTLEDA